MSATATRKRKAFTAEQREEWREQKQARANSVLDEVVGMFERDELPDLIAQTTIARLEGAPIGRWSLLNQLQAIKASTTDARGFRQWQEVGRQVKRGCRAFYILGPRMIGEEDPTLERRTRSA